MAEDKKPIIVVKRIKKVAGGHHGGAWKIAYADFVTAMMAFFLLMWLLGSTTKGDLSGIAEYFKTPLKVAMAGGSGSGSSNSILDKGGQDLTRKSGQVKNSDTKNPDKKINIKTAKAELARLEMDALKVLKAKIQGAIESNAKLNKFKNQLMLDITSDGLRIQIVDDLNRPMFKVSSAELQPYTKEILGEIGHMLNGVPNKIGLSGHTDALPYSNGEKTYSNWELSADRANASRRELIAGGMDESKLLRVIGLGSAVLFNKEDPLNASNRRISIIIMNKSAEDKVMEDNASKRISSEADQAVIGETLQIKTAEKIAIKPVLGSPAADLSAKAATLPVL